MDAKCHWSVSIAYYTDVLTGDNESLIVAEDEESNSLVSAGIILLEISVF